MRISDWSSDVCSSDLLVKEGGRVEKLSVAVLVNGTYAGDGESRSYQPRGAEEMKKIETLVKSALGYSEDREDTVQEIGRASCRERVCQYGSISVVAVS